MKKKLLVIYILLNTSLFSVDNADKIISKQLNKIFGDDITLDQIERVLEFDNNNRNALIQKAFYMDSDDISLNISNDILKNIDIDSLESKLHYISILYRLKKYEEIIEFSNNINVNTLNSSDTLYFIADSYIRIGSLTKSQAIIQMAKHQFPSDQRFYELSYVLSKDRKILYSISTLNNPLQSFIRLYNRVSDILPELTLEVLIESELSKLDNSLLETYVGNYKVLKILFKNTNINLFNGLYRLDVDSDSYPDTIFKVNNGIIEYKGFDRDSDNVIDYEIFLENSIPSSIVIDGNILKYDEYPYIDYVSIKGTERITYDLYKRYTKKRVTSLTGPVDLKLVVDDIPKLKLIGKSYYKNKNLIKKIIYKNNNSFIVYSEPNIHGKFDKCLYLYNDIIKSGLRDLNSDGIFDLCEIYENGELVATAYSETGKNDEVTYIENYSSFESDYTDRIDFYWWQE